MCSAARCSPRPADSTPLGEDGDSEFGDLIEDSEAIQPGEAVSFTLLQEQLHSVPRACRESRPWLWPAELLSLPSCRDDHQSCACGSCSY